LHSDQRSTSHDTTRSLTWSDIGKGCNTSLVIANFWQCDVLFADKRKYYVYGPTVFIGVRAFIFPLLLLKTHVQVGENRAVCWLAVTVCVSSEFQMHIGSSHSIRDSIKHVLKTDGPRGFYKGFGVHALNTFISQVSLVVWGLVCGRSGCVNLRTGFVYSPVLHYYI
jgi:hypothetical protein